MKRLIVTGLPAILGMLLCAVNGGLAQDGSADKTRPDLKLWSSLRRSLVAADGEDFFQQNLKGFALPVMIGTLISSTPAERPTILVIGLSNPATPEIRLRLKDDSGADAPLKGPIAPGSQIRFEGVPTAFTKDPFMLTIETSPNFGLGKPRRR